MVDGLPDGASINLEAGAIREMLDEEPESEREGRLTDLTIEEVAEEFDRSESAVRSWCQQELIPGAYKFRGREWRIPPEGVRAFQRQEAEGDLSPARAAEVPGRGGDDDLSSWKEHYQNGNGGA